MKFSNCFLPITNTYGTKIEALIDAKEKDIMTV